jgi:hypothetical protein
MEKEENTRGELLALVYQQIISDVYVDDFTAIAQLLQEVSIESLKEYLAKKD